MHVKQRLFCISGPSFCSTHLFLTFQALDFNMLQPHSAINLSLSALAFLLKVIFFSPCIPIFNSPLLTQINLPTTPTLLPCKCMKHTDIYAWRLAKRTQTHNPASSSSSHKGPILINLLLYWRWVSLQRRKRVKEEQDRNHQKGKDWGGRRRRLSDSRHIMKMAEAAEDKSVFTSKSVLCRISLAT